MHQRSQRFVPTVWQSVAAWLKTPLSMGTRHAADPIAHRKFMQVNIGLWMSLVVNMGYIFVYATMGHKALLFSGLAQLPVNLIMVVSTAYFLHHGRYVLALYAVELTTMLTVCGAIVIAQGTALGTHCFFLTMAVMAPAMFPVHRWRGMATLSTFNVLLFVFFEWHGWAPDPSVAALPPSTLLWLKTSVILSCLILAALMIILMEVSASHNETTLQNMANTDALTLLPNRRAFRNSLQRELKRSQRQSSLTAVAIIDVDFFKTINDTYGHDQGDAVLQKLAQLLLQQSRGGDTVARVGGEEFAVLMPNTSLTHALTVVERMREHACQASFGLAQLDLHITISVGLTTFHAGMEEKAVLKTADTALYEAKNTGRNRVVAHEMDITTVTS